MNRYKESKEAIESAKKEKIQPLSKIDKCCYLIGFLLKELSFEQKKEINEWLNDNGELN